MEYRSWYEVLHIAPPTRSWHLIGAKFQKKGMIWSVICYTWICQFLQNLAANQFEYIWHSNLCQTGRTKRLPNFHGVCVCILHHCRNICCSCSTWFLCSGGRRFICSGVRLMTCWSSAFSISGVNCNFTRKEYQ